MADWKLVTNYDYRFGALMLQVHHDAEVSPIYKMSMADILRQMPRHEIAACLELADKPAEPEPPLEEMRQDLIRNTYLKGKTVLDIGGYDGWAAKLALDCGASRAICLDNQQYHHYGWEDKQFKGVEYVQGDFMNKGNFTGWEGDDRCAGLLPYSYDTLIFYNVLYHLKNPWAALDHLRELVKPDGEMLLCTLFRYWDQPVWYIYEPLECNPTDRTVYWGPSISGLERLLRFTGWDFKQEGLAGDRVCYRCKPIPNFEPDLAKEGYARS